MAEKIKILTVSVKRSGTGKNNKPYKVLTVELEDKRIVETFDEVEQGKEYNVEITQTEAYGLNMKVIKDSPGGKFPPKNYTTEHRKTALECSIETGKMAGFHDKENIIKVAEFYFNWLKQ